MTSVCENCGRVIKNTEYSFKIRKSLSFIARNACSKECFLALLNREGINVYPAKNYRSIPKCSIAAFVLSIVALLMQIIRTIWVLL